MPMKYVVMDIGGAEVPMLFPENVQHSDFACWIKQSVPASKPVSAGFVRQGADGLVAYGKSLSLNISSRESDTALVKQCLEH